MISSQMTGKFVAGEAAAARATLAKGNRAPGAGGLLLQPGVCVVWPAVEQLGQGERRHTLDGRCKSHFNFSMCEIDVQSFNLKHVYCGVLVLNWWSLRTYIFFPHHQVSNQIDSTALNCISQKHRTL